jgi:rubrerythrin
MSANERKDLERKIEALIIAIPRETDAQEFYLQLEREYEDPASKEMFKFLAEQEKGHRLHLEAILARLDEKLAKLPK